MNTQEICSWHYTKMSLISKWYKEGKISFSKKLAFQNAITIAMYNRL